MGTPPMALLAALSAPMVFVVGISSGGDCQFEYSSDEDMLLEEVSATRNLYCDS